VRRLALIVSIAVLAAAGCGESSVATTTTTTPATTTLPETPLAVVPRDYDGFRAQPTACGADAPEPVTPMQFEAPGDAGLSGAAPAEVLMSTSCGDLTIELDFDAAPETAGSFAFLAAQGYFDGTAMHRLIPGYILQGGDPTATGTGGPGYALPDEFPPAGTVYERGMIAMANAGPGTSGSQFFIMLGDAELPPQYTIFGRVVDGLSTLDAIEQTRLGEAPGSRDPVPSTPLATIYINRVTVSE
jgi:peptidyl-prolyl cis-trans isomerase B (cyclophilin B)